MQVPLACFAITMELSGQVDVTDEDAATNASALLRFLQRYCVIDDELRPLPELRCGTDPAKRRGCANLSPSPPALGRPASWFTVSGWAIRWPLARW